MGVRSWSPNGLEVGVQTGSPAHGAGISDESYAAVGARLLVTLKRPGLHIVVKFKENRTAGVRLPARDSVLFILSAPAAYPDVGRGLLDAGTTGVAYRNCPARQRQPFPCWRRLSEIAVAGGPGGAHLLEKPMAFRGG